MIVFSSKQPRSAFTLVETTIAFAIAAVALVSLMGLMATIMSTSGQTIDRFASARIIQAIHQEFLMKKWEAIEVSAAPEIRYFSEQGDEVEKGVFEAVYVARISISIAPELPGLSEGAIERLEHSDRFGKNRARLKIEVSNQVQSTDPFSISSAMREFSGLLVKLDK